MSDAWETREGETGESYLYNRSTGEVKWQSSGSPEEPLLPTSTKKKRKRKKSGDGWSSGHDPITVCCDPLFDAVDSCVKTADPALFGVGSKVCSAFDPIKNTKALFIRRDSNLAPLDGIRAFAFFWVLAVHVWEAVKDLNKDVREDEFSTHPTGMFRVSQMGAYGVTTFFVLSGFLIPYILIKQFQVFGTVNTPLFFWRRLLRIWPTLQVAVLITIYWSLDWFTVAKRVGGAKPDVVVEQDFGIPCESHWWTNMIFITNFYSSEETVCYGTLWSVSVEFQLYLVTPLAVYIYTRSRRWGYYLITLMIVISLISRLWVNLQFRLWERGSWDGSDGHADNAQFNYRRPYTRLAEYQAGTLACFSYLDSLDDVFDTAMIDFCHLREAVGIAGFQKIVHKIFKPVLHLAILVVGCLFVYCGDMNQYAWPYDISPGVTLICQVMSDFIVACFVAYLMRTALTPRHSEYTASFFLDKFFGWWGWYPFASMSYTGYLIQLQVAFYAVVGLDYWCGISPEPTYLYFTRAYFFTLALNLPIAYLLSVTIERPFNNLRNITFSDLAMFARAVLCCPCVALAGGGAAPASSRQA